MHHFTANNFYIANQKRGSFGAILLFLCSVMIIFAIFYIFFVYFSVWLSYEIGNEMRLTKELDQSYQELEAAYIVRLEKLLNDGRSSLGLVAPHEQIFVERYYEVAKVGP